MRNVINLLKDLLIGGVVFLLPIGIIAVVFGKLLSISEKVGHAVNDLLFPGLKSEVVVLTVAIALLVIIALAAGMFANTGLGKRVFATLEREVLARLPIYTVLRQMIADMSGNLDRLTEGGELKVVAVRFDDQTQIGFLVDELADGRKIVFMPGAPSALSGTVVIVEADRVTETEMKAQQVMGAMRRLGAGLVRVAQASREG